MKTAYKLPKHNFISPDERLNKNIVCISVHDPNTVQDNKQPTVSTHEPVIGHSCIGLLWNISLSSPVHVTGNLKEWSSIKTIRAHFLSIPISMKPEW